MTSLEKIEVGPISGGWRLKWPASDLVLVYRSGSKAERQAYQLAETLVEQGRTVQVLIRDHQDVVVGSAISGPGEGRRPLRASR